jgi:predicted amidophosphoribosyltransferase
VVRAFLDLVFPPRCAGCDLPGTLLCDRCRAAVPRIDPASACSRCGAPVTGVSCAECAGRTFAFRAARSAALLEPPVSRAIVVLKDGGERRYAAVLASLLAEAADGWLGQGDVLVPVPASPAARRRRGFDHALDVTRALGTLTGMPVAEVLRSKVTADQRTLGREQRAANRAGSFDVTGEVTGGRVVLVDDVFTTGATLDAAARALIGVGSPTIRALSVARACSRATPAEVRA